MNRRHLLIGTALAFANAFCRGPARAEVAQRAPVALVIAMPANRSAALQKQIRQDIARLYVGAAPGDRLVFVNASTLQQIAAITVPDNLGDSDRERDDALLDLFAPVYRFVARSDPSAPLDNLHIPPLLREIGRNVLGQFPDHKANVILIGSVIWDEPKDANWTFRDHLPSDYFLNMAGGAFGVAGEESILSGARVSILYSERPENFAYEGFRGAIVDLWRKSIRGRAGRVGEIGPYGSGSYDRFFAATEDTTPAVISTTAPRVVYEAGGHLVPVQRLGELPLPGESGNERSATAAPSQGGGQPRRRVARPQGAPGAAGGHQRPAGNPGPDALERGS